MPKLSIIIPHFNSINSLDKLIDSIPETEEIEVIIVDDNSDIGPENLARFVREKKRNEIHLYFNIAGPKGAGTCRNIGLKHSNGEWVLFADSDDFFVDNFYETTKNYFTEDYDVVFFNATSIEMDTGRLSDRHIPIDNLIKNYLSNQGLEDEMRLKYCFYVPWAKLYKKTFLLEFDILFDEVPASNDVMFSTKVGYYSRKYTVTDEIIYCVTRNKGSLTMIMNETVYNARLDVFLRNYEYLRVRLKNTEFKLLGMNGRRMIIYAFKYGLGFRKAFGTIRLMVNNKVKIFELSLLNPILIVKQGWYYLKKYKVQRKYFKKI